MKTYIEQNFVDKTQIKLISEKPTGGRIIRIVHVPPQVGDALKLEIGELAKFAPSDTVIPSSNNLAYDVPTPMAGLRVMEGGAD